jgi:16S rRNA C967 or C1407 C5-methylase (RsmB/RsmF family)
MQSLLSRKYAAILDDVGAFERTIATPLPGCFWMNPKRANELDLLGAMNAAGIACEPLEWMPHAWRVDAGVKLGNTIPYAAGWYCVQEEVALTAVKALNPQPGEKVLDMCASPGGKTAQISYAVGDDGCVVANEKQWQRLTALATKVDAMGLTNVVVTHANAMALTLEPASFDKALADVPCSGEGTVRKLTGGLRPLEERLERILPETQAVILRRALRLVKPGGVVVYSTCTMNPNENEAVLSAALGDLGMVEECSFPGFVSRPGVLGWEGRSFREDVRNAHRFYPHHNNTGGFFVAKIRRTDVPFRREKEPRENCRNEYRDLLPEESEHVLRWLSYRYEVPRSFFAGLRMVQRANVIRLIASHVSIPNENIDLVGVGAFEKTSKGFVLTAPGAQMISGVAQRAVVQLSAGDELHEFMRGGKASLAMPSAWKGIVVVRQGPFGLGKGILENNILESHLPKAFRFQMTR